MADFDNADDSDDPYRAIRVGDPGETGEATKWGLLLTRFMRLIAAFWLIQGLAQWRVVLVSPQPIFDTMPQAAAVAVVFFGVADLVAGVGLWLATPWGGVLWLLIASAQIFVATGMPNFFSGGYFLIGIDVVLIALYFILTFEAGRDIEAKQVLDRRQRRRASLLRQTGAPPPETLGATLMRHISTLPFMSSKPRSKKREAQPEPPNKPPVAPPTSVPPRPSTSAPAQPNGRKAPSSAPADPDRKRFAGPLQAATRNAGAAPSASRQSAVPPPAPSKNGPPPRQDGA